MLEEDDLVHGHHHDLEAGMDMDMDANLDDDIPEAESGGYEHTDSEASFGDSEEERAASLTRGPHNWGGLEPVWRRAREQGTASISIASCQGWQQPHGKQSAGATEKLGAPTRHAL